jgi:hypothetical protein
MRALLIENSYKGTKDELRGGINDIAVMFRLIPDFDVIVLKDPSREKFIEAFIEILKNETLSLFYYSGHGSNNEVVTSDFLNIKDDVFKQLIRSHLKGTLFAIFDSCFSGSMLDLKYRYSYEEDTLIETEKTETQDVYFLSASDNLSYEVKVNNKFNGVLTLLLEKADTTTWRTLIRSIVFLDKYDNIMINDYPVFSTGRKIDMDSTLSDTFI